MKVLYITCSGEEEARSIASALLDRKMIACANFFPIKSMFWWEGRLEDGSEVVALLKTTDKMSGKVVEEVKKMHSYDVPCILTISVEANEEFEKWVGAEVRGLR